MYYGSPIRIKRVGKSQRAYLKKDKNFPSFLKYVDIKIRAKQSPNKIKSKRPTLRYIMIELIFHLKRESRINLTQNYYENNEHR